MYFEYLSYIRQDIKLGFAWMQVNSFAELQPWSVDDRTVESPVLDIGYLLGIHWLNPKPQNFGCWPRRLKHGQMIEQMAQDCMPPFFSILTTSRL